MADEDFYPETPNDPWFLIEERTLNYQDAWSIRLTEKELNAARVQVVVSPYYVSFRADANLEYNPRKSVFLRGTAWSQDIGVTRDFLVHFRSQVIMDYRNEGMLTRFWMNVLTAFRDRLSALQGLLVAQQLQTIPPFVSYGIYVPGAVTLDAEYESYLDESNMCPQVREDGVHLLPSLGFAPPETVWKFTPDRPGIWSQVTVKIWLLRDFSSLPIAPIGVDDEEPNSNSDGQNNQATPDPGTPPDPAEESPYDPRNGEDDYSTAPPPEPDPEEPEPYQIRVVISGSFGTTLNSNGQQIPNSAGEIVGCGEALSEPAPTIVSDSNYQNIQGWTGWTVNYTDLAGNPRKRFVGDGGPDRTTYGSPSVQVFEC